MAAKQDKPAGKKNIAPANGNFTPHATYAPMENSKQQLHDIIPAEAAGEAEVTVESGGILPKDPKALPSPGNLVPSDRPLEKSMPLLRPAPLEAPSKEPELLSLKNSDDAYEKPRLAVAEQPVVKPGGVGEESAAPLEENETPPELSLLDELPFLEGKENKSNDKLDVESLPQRESLAPRQVTPITSPKPDLPNENRKDAYSDLERTSPNKTLEPTSPNKTLEPTSPNNMKYSSRANQPEDTVVMINIGRIEVKAEAPATPALRVKFSPALSLADYLKQRSEGKIG
jgi:hypothetical protein